MLEGRSKANGTFLELDFLPLFGLGSTKSDVHFGFNRIFAKDVNLVALLTSSSHGIWNQREGKVR